MANGLEETPSEQRADGKQNRGLNPLSGVTGPGTRNPKPGTRNASMVYCPSSMVFFHVSGRITERTTNCLQITLKSPGGI